MKEINLFPGYLIKKLRKLYSVSGKQLSEALYISQSTLSKIENYSQAATSELFIKTIIFFQGIDNTIIFDPALNLKQELDSAARNIISSFIDYSFYSNPYQYDWFFEKFRNIYSWDYCNLAILEKFYLAINSRLEVSDELLQEIHSYILDDSYLFLYYETLFILMIQTRDHCSAEEYLQKASSLAAKIDIPGLKGVMEYHAVTISIRLRKPGKALALFDSAFIDLQKAGAFKRLTFLESYKGIIYETMQLYPEAEAIFMNLKNKIVQLQIPFFERAIHENLSWLYLKWGKYDLCLQAGKTARKMNSRYPDVGIAMVYAAMKSGKYEESENLLVSEILMCRKLKTDQSAFVLQILLLIKNIYENKEQQIEHTLKTIFSQIDLFKNVEAELVIYPLLIEFYRNKQNADLDHYYSDCYVKYLSQGFN